jgi:putative transcriptional regulator
MCQAPLTRRSCKANLTCMQNDVRERRGARGLSQGDLGKALGVSRQTINAIETGRYLPSLPLAIALARFFETNVEEIFLAENGDLR